MQPPPLSQIADFRGPSAPLTFAVDVKSKPGAVVLHQVTINTVEVPPAEAKGMISMVHAENEPRLIWLAYAMAGSQGEMIRLRVHRLLELMAMLDPTTGPERHPEFPLRLVGEDPEISEFSRLLNELAGLIGYKKPE